MGAVAGMLVWSAAAHAAPADRAAAVALVAAQRQDEAVASGWTGNAASCTVGTESQASLDATLRSVNRFRAMTGLGPVGFDPALNARALAAALMMHAKDDLEHQPGRDWPCYTDAGADGAAHSNLFLSSGDATGARAVAEFMTDIGHGRWVTNPGGPQDPGRLAAAHRHAAGGRRHREGRACRGLPVAARRADDPRRHEVHLPRARAGPRPPHQRPRHRAQHGRRAHRAPHERVGPRLSVSRGRGGCTSPPPARDWRRGACAGCA